MSDNGPAFASAAYNRSLRLLLFLCFATFLWPASVISASDPKEAVIAYVFVKDRILQPDEIAATKLTRVNYAFANIQDGEVVEGFAHDAENFAVLTGLKKANAALRILVSVGGWTWSGGFSEMAMSIESRKRFIDSSLRFIEKYALDGLDIDWEYPGLVGMDNPFRVEDRENYTSLLREMRLRFDQEEARFGRKLLISVATGASEEFLAHTQMDQVARYVDSVNLMSYDYVEPSSSPLTGHHAPLFANPAGPTGISADDSVKAYLAAGVPAEKLVLGVPFYGHAWSDVPDTAHGLFQSGKPARLDASYRNITSSFLNGGYVRYWDEAASAPYLYNQLTHTFVSYDDVESITLKAEYVSKHGLGGIMFWEYHGDANNALLDAIHAGFRK